VLFLYTDLG